VGCNQEFTGCGKFKPLKACIACTDSLLPLWLVTTRVCPLMAVVSWRLNCWPFLVYRCLLSRDHRLIVADWPVWMCLSHVLQ